jgi:hypothetical protein
MRVSEAATLYSYICEISGKNLEKALTFEMHAMLLLRRLSISLYQSTYI